MMYFVKLSNTNKTFFLTLIAVNSKHKVFKQMFHFGLAYIFLNNVPKMKKNPIYEICFLLVFFSSEIVVF